MAAEKITLVQLSEDLDNGLSIEKISEKYGMNRRSIQRRIRRAQNAGLLDDIGFAPVMPEGQLLRGVSTLMHSERGPILQWFKTATDHEKQIELLEQAVQELSQDIIPLKTFERETAHINNEDLVTCYVVTDYHLGMMAWHEESGEDWDMKIAEELLLDWFGMAISSSPNSSVGIFAQLGDFMHWDGLEAVTPQNKHNLDADTRIQKLIRVTIRVTRQIIEMMLQKHDHVVVLFPGGNHDPASTLWLREAFSSFLTDHERVTVDNSADSYCVYEHGLTSLFFHHGHKRRVKNIDDVFVAKFREIFGRTKYSYAHMGHFHHRDVKETNLMIIEQHRTLAAKDAYASHGGWLAGREAQSITYHKKYGEVSRVVISPDMVYNK